MITVKEEKKIGIPEVNIGTFGHVDHGKTTLVEALTGKRTDVHSEEQKRGITIRLGYANANFYFCETCGYFSSPLILYACPNCGAPCKYLRTVSFVDAPGHEMLTATVLAATSLVDGALLVIDAKEGIMEQTKEHLMALNIANVKNIVIIQNKIDLVSEEKAKKNYEEIKNFVKGTVAENAPIIPISAQRKININFVVEAIEEKIPTPERKIGEPKFLIGRSFDVNKPGTKVKELKGGVIGGSLSRGRIRINDEIEIRPGLLIKDEWKSIITKVVSIRHGDVEVEECSPGGLVGIMTTLDPSLTKADSLAGQIAGKNLPDITSNVEVQIRLVKDVKLSKGENIIVIHGVTKTLGIIENIKKDDKIQISLKIPICVEKNERIVISKMINNTWRLVGYGEIINI
ncbi:MAG: translation initiation factor IF-2 subunit gamma [Candidatus Aenigmatarchaeota archaeon]